MSGTAAHGSGRDPVSLDEARRALGDGTAVVLPNPAPLTHVVTARRAATVNAAKGRPTGRPVALWSHHPGTLRTLDGVWRLPHDRRELVRRLLAEEHLTVLVPVREGAGPHWLAPAVEDGWMLLFGARWQPLRPLLDEHPVLYVSSANRTGRAPAATAAEALGMFPDGVPVLASPHTEEAAPARRATTTVRVPADGDLTLHRPGAQDEPHPTPDHYLRHLADRYPLAGGR
ncbi:hypothetical protein ACIPRD_16375 [Streptomyces sp. NPDC090108]|uniref:hypothetical protein n=1 Tax=Streptomyces sp. NPDC090108 TaxID=3365947 RepID=UPI003829B832